MFSDNQISASIEQMLTTHGPMTIQQFVETTDLSAANELLFERVLTENDEFEKGADQQ
jgi:hypothetical protein